MYNNIRERICSIAKKSARDQLVKGTSGNVSEFIREENIMGITPSGLSYEVITADDIVIMKLDGEIIYAKENLKPSSEWRMHGEIYKSLENVNAVVHTHSPKATSFAVVNETIPIILIEMVPFIGGDIQVADFGMPGTEELGKKAVEKLQNRFACLLKNHGLVAVGENLDSAYLSAIYVEDAATIYHNAKQVGTPIVISDDIIKEMMDILLCGSK